MGSSPPSLEDRRLVNSNNFATSAVLSEVYALLSAILVVIMIVLHL